tara:strand:+ start:75 stop:974 length:900 start_codon:yes stop_codon:yes gene_type:complete
MQLINTFIYKILKLFPNRIIKIFSKRYVAGFNLKETLDICKKLNTKGFTLTLDILGEHTQSSNEADCITKEYQNLLKSIHSNGIDANISVKPTHIGNDLGKEVFKTNLSKLLETAEKYSNFVRIDMEDSKTTDDTISTYRELSEKHKNLGIVFQAYLFRTFKDIQSFSDKKLNFRLCKGIYRESEEIAFHNRNQINDNYIKILDYALSNEIYIGIATHDEYLLKESYRLIKKHQAKAENFEFQALYGVPLDKWHKKHLKNNYKVRLYMPFGDDWYDYSLRRIKENPSIAKYVLKNLFKN